MRQHTSLSPPAQEGGQTLVEFALTVMVLLLLVFGLIDFSRAVYAASIVQWAAQQGARVGIKEVPDDPTLAELQVVVEPAVLDRLTGLNVDQATVVVSEPGPDLVQVDVTYHFEFIVPLIKQFDRDGVDFQASASMVAH